MFCIAKPVKPENIALQLLGSNMLAQVKTPHFKSILVPTVAYWLPSERSMILFLIPQAQNRQSIPLPIQC